MKEYKEYDEQCENCIHRHVVVNWYIYEFCLKIADDGKTECIDAWDECQGEHFERKVT